MVLSAVLEGSGPELVGERRMDWRRVVAFIGSNSIHGIIVGSTLGTPVMVGLPLTLGPSELQVGLPVVGDAVGGAGASSANIDAATVGLGVIGEEEEGG
jgi:hypothetical protein